MLIVGGSVVVGAWLAMLRYLIADKAPHAAKMG